MSIRAACDRRTSPPDNLWHFDGATKRSTAIASAFYCHCTTWSRLQIDCICEKHHPPYLVGYAQAGLRSGFTARGASFIPVGGGSYNLQDIVVSGYEGENADTVNLQLLDTMGYTAETYYWADLPDDGITGWLNADEEIPTDVVFGAGDGFWVNSADATLKLQTAGAVSKADVAVDLRNGFRMIANPMPSEINLQDITVTGYEGENADTVNIQILDTMGYTVATYYWADLPDDGIVGWLNADEELPDDVVFDAGDALWVNSTDASLQLVFPSPVAD